MGAHATSALAIAVVPHGLEAKVEEALCQMPGRRDGHAGRGGLRARGRAQRRGRRAVAGCTAHARQCWHCIPCLHACVPSSDPGASPMGRSLIRAHIARLSWRIASAGIVVCNTIYGALSSLPEGSYKE